MKILCHFIKNEAKALKHSIIIMNGIITKTADIKWSEEKMKLRMMIGLLVLVMFLGACGDTNSKSDDTLKGNGEIDIKTLVNDYSVGKISDQTASITSTELIVTESDETETTYPLPDDEFFVSIAPFISETHPCTIHSLTGCQGELVDKDLDFYIEDENGQVVVDETFNSGANGFIDLWLPRDQTFQVKINYDGKETKSEISTFEDDGTCITTMQLL